MKRLLLLLVFAASTGWADFGEYESHETFGNTLVIATTDGALRLTAVDDAAFEVHYAERGVKQLPSFALAPQNGEFASAVTETDTTIAFRIDGLTAVVDKSPVRVSYFRDGEPLVEEEHGYFAHDTLRGFRFALEDGEKILGGGQRVMGMDRRGKRMPLYNKASYGYTTEAEQMYYSLPAIMSTDRYMIVFDNSANGWLDIGHAEEDVLQFEAVGGRTSYIVVAGDTYPELIENYTDTTGSSRCRRAGPSVTMRLVSVITRRKKPAMSSSDSSVPTFHSMPLFWIYTGSAPTSRGTWAISIGTATRGPDPRK